jgi:nitrogen regulatory protein PII
MAMFHKAIKIIVVTEKFVERHVRDVIGAHGGKGYTLVSAGGKGMHHFHSTEARASVVEDFSNIKIEAIVRERATAEEIAQAVMNEVFDQYPGIIYLEDVEVWRQERF